MNELRTSTLTGPAGLLLRRWRDGESPELAAAVAALNAVSPSEFVALVRVDQQERWRLGERVRAEEYFEAFPLLLENEEDALVVLCGEIELACRSGPAPSADSFQQRFPQWAEHLGLQMALQLALHGEEAETGPAAGPPQPATPWPNLPGYEFLALLGSGGMGVVYKARQTALKRVVAVKVLHGAAAGGTGLLRMQLEAEAVARLDHPNIVRVFALEQHEGQPFLVMELVEGGTLAQRLVAGPMPAADAARLVEALAQAMHHAHQRGVIHRDIKPANVLGPAGQPRVTDFGLARHGDTGLSTAGAVLGTPAYMSPEQAAGEHATASSDVYSLGVVLYECLAGRAPFSGDNVPSLLRKVREEEPAPPGQLRLGVPADLEVICLKCLHKEPERRYESAAALAGDLTAWREGRPIAARPAGALERAWMWLRRRPAVAASLLVGLLVVALACLGLHAHHRDLQARGASIRVGALRSADTAEVLRCVRDLQEVGDWAAPLLEAVWDDPGAGPREKLHAALALLALRPGQCDRQIAYLLVRLGDAPPETVPVLRVALGPHRDQLLAPLREMVRGPDAPASLRAACLLAAYSPEDEALRARADTLVARALAEGPLHLGRWQAELKPARELLLPALEKQFAALPDSSPTRFLVANLLADWGEGRWRRLANWLADVDAPTHGLFLDRLRRGQERAGQALTSILDEGASGRERLDWRQARAAAALMRLGETARVWPLLRHRADPGLRSALVHVMPRLGVSPELLAGRLLVEKDASARRALVLALGGYGPGRVKRPRHLKAWLLERYEHDADPGLHSAVGWLLRVRWREKVKQLDEIDGRLRGKGPGARRWYVGKQGQTFVLVPGPTTFIMGSPVSEPDRGKNEEARHRRRIGRTFALCTTKVSVAQFRAFLAERPEIVHRLVEENSPYPDGPVISVSWYQAAAFCNWLSEKEGIPKEQWCYLPNARGRYAHGMRPAPGYLTRGGYRLPSEAEWECACRAGASTGRPYGSGTRLLGEYAWYHRNATGYAMRNGLLLPNDLGLFDMLGNAWEWCHERARPYPVWGETVLEDLPDAGAVVDEVDRLVRGGAFVEAPALLRCAHRCFYAPEGKDCSVGFRVARTVKGTK